MVHVPVRYILCIIANDAEYAGNRYCDVGSNFKLRANEAMTWSEARLPGQTIVWAFGAGADTPYAQGPTLGMLGEAYLRQRFPHAVTLTNHEHSKYYGTLEEIYWMVKRARQTYRGEKLVFVFFTQSRHMPRVRRILRKFHSNVSAQFVKTGQTKEIPWRDVVKSYVKLRMIERGWVEPRYVS